MTTKRLCQCGHPEATHYTSSEASWRDRDICVEDACECKRYKPVVKRREK